MSDEWDMVEKMHNVVYSTYLRCPIQKRAVKHAVTQLVQDDLFWAHESSDGSLETAPMDNAMEQKIWRDFIARLVVQFQVFGYALYRVVRVRGAKSKDTQYKGESTDVQRDTVRLEVANSQTAFIEWNAKLSEWEVRSLNGERSSTFHARGWYLAIFDEPSRVNLTNLPMLNSASANCQEASKLYMDIKRRIDRRDQLNSEPVGYTTISKHLVTSGGSTLPWFVNPSTVQDNAHISIPGADQTDFNALMSGRLETLQNLDRMSQTIRKEARSAYETMDRPRLVGPKKQNKRPTRVDADAQELFITDGRDFHEMSHRQGPAELQQTMDRLVKEIHFAHGVTPQSFGMSGNSERLTSNDRLAQIAIVISEDHVNRLRDIIQDAVRKISVKLSGDDKGATFVKIQPCPTAYNLEQIVPLLKPEFVKKTLACIYKLPENVFVDSAIKDYQKIKLFGEKIMADGAGDVDAGGGTKRPGEDNTSRPKMSQKDKQDRQNKKAKV